MVVAVFTPPVGWGYFKLPLQGVKNAILTFFLGPFNPQLVFMKNMVIRRLRGQARYLGGGTFTPPAATLWVWLF